MNWFPFRSKPAAVAQPTEPPKSAADGVPPPTPAVAMDGFLNVMSALGSGSDKNAYSTYSIPVQMVQPQLDAMYRGSWLAGKIVDAPVADMTREWVALSWDGRDDGDDDSNAIEAEEKRIGFRGAVRTGMKWARLYGGAVTIIVTRGQRLDEPLDVTKIKKGDVLNFVTRDRWRIPPTTDVGQDMTDPNNFDLPSLYSLADQGLMGVAANTSAQVHSSRIIRWPGRELPFYQWRKNGMWDDSELFHVVNAVQNYDGACAAAGSMLHEANVDIISAKGLVQALASGSADKIAARYQLGAFNKSINKALVIDAEKESWQQKVSSFSGVEAVLVRFMIDVSGAADIPTTRLFGQSPAGLSATGESDIRNYYDRLSGDQESKLRKPLEKLYEALVRSTLGFLPDGFALTFNPLWQMSDVEAATRDSTRGTMDVGYITAGVIDRGTVARELMDRGVYRTLEEEDVDEADERDDEATEASASAAAGAVPGAGQQPTPNQGSEVPASANGTEETPPAAEVTLPKQAGRESGDSAPSSCPKWFADCLSAHDSVVIVGGPKSGKSTLAGMVSDRQTWCTDDLLEDGKTTFAQAPTAVKAKAADMGKRYVIEGVHTARALRSGLTADCVVQMNGPKVPLSDGQATMAKGVAKVFDDWRAANPGAKVVREPATTGDRARIGDTFKHDGTGWTVYRDGKRIGGPYATLSKARRRLKMG